MITTLQLVSAVSQKGDSVLNQDNRNLLSVAFKNVVGYRRSAWRVYRAQAAKSSESQLELIESMVKEVQEEINQYCDQVIVSSQSQAECGYHDTFILILLFFVLGMLTSPNTQQQL